MEMQMITLIQHVPEWCKDFTPGVWQFDNLESFLKTPLFEYFAKTFLSAGYTDARFSYNDDNVITAHFKKESPIPHEADVVLGTVDNIDEFIKMMRA